MGKSASRCIRLVKRAMSLPFAIRRPAKWPALRLRLSSLTSIRHSPIGAGRMRLTVSRLKMGEAFARGRPLDGAADQRRGRAGVLVVGMPGAAGQLPRVKDALAHFDISGFQGAAHW